MTWRRAVLAWLMLAGPVHAQAAAEPQADAAVSTDEPSATPRPGPLPWRGTTLRWWQSLTTETVGLGQSTQRRNPTWELGYSLRPRYYVYGDSTQVVSIRGEVGISRELTNSDTTTERGEWSLTDALLYGAYARVVHEAGEEGPAPSLPDALRVRATPEYLTAVAVRLPVLTFPTSTISRRNGTQLGLGVLAALSQSLPVLGLHSAFLPAADAQLVAGYTHLLTEATEPTGSAFERVRMTPDGTSVVSDQLGGAAFARSQLTLLVAGTLYLTEHVSWSNTWGWRPSWKYPFADRQEICLDTGCTVIDSIEDRRTFAVVTQFASEVGVRALSVLGVSFGYTNVTLQLGPDGKRRNMLYSPAARFQLAVTLHLDELYQTAAGRRRRAAPGAVARRGLLR